MASPPPRGPTWASEGGRRPLGWLRESSDPAANKARKEAELAAATAEQ